jgi:DNA-binding IclR family transcriptional regulator
MEGWLARKDRTTSERDDFRPVKSSDRTVDVLEALAGASRRLSLADLARALGIPKSSLHAILRTLHRRGWIEADETGTRFQLGIRALLTGAAYVDTDPDVASMQPTLDWLAERTGETCHLGRLDGADIVYLAKRESRHPIRLYSAVGRRLPAHATALGKAVLAWRSPEEVERLLPTPLPRMTTQTITDTDALRADLALIRQRGWAEDHEETMDGIRCWAMTVPTSSPPQDAVSISASASGRTAGRSS